MKSVVTIVMGDPAESGDPTGIVGITGNFMTKKIHVKLAKQFKQRDKNVRLQKTGEYLLRVRKKIHPDFMGMESNNDGKEIIGKLNLIPLMKLTSINTSANLADETRLRGYSMDKPLMVEWFANQKKLHNIVFADDTKGDMQELIDQIGMIVSGKSPGGSTTFKAARNRHDDLFLALLLCCHVFLVYLNRWEARHGRH